MSLTQIFCSDPFGAKIIAEEHPLGTPLSFDTAMLTETELNSVNNSKTMITDQQINQSFLINERQRNEMEKLDPPSKEGGQVNVSQRTSVSSGRSKQSTSKSNHFSLKHYMSNNSRKISDSSRKQSNSSEVREWYRDLFKNLV